MNPSRLAASLRRRLGAPLAALLLLSPVPAPAAVEPVPAGPAVGQLVVRMLEQGHYNRRSVDDDVSKRFLRNYLEAYDYNHLFFTQPEVEEFERRYANSLDDRLRFGDVRPAYEVFDRFLARLEERAAFVKKVTASSPTFTTDEAIVVDRHESPWPSTAVEADQLWRQSVKYELLQARLSGQKPEEQVKGVNTRYDRLLRSYREFDGTEVLQTYLTALAQAYDPHSEFLAAAKEENFDISMRLSLVGIGAVLRSEDGYARIVSLVPGGPADRDKRLKPNDKIEAVAQGDGPFVDVVGMKLDKVVALIRGEKATTVRLRVIPVDALDPSTRVIIALVREEVKLRDQEAKARVITLPEAGGRRRKIGVIDLPSFYADLKNGGASKSTTRDARKLLDRLAAEPIDGLVLDLRRNGGGSLNEAIHLTGLFIRSGPVVQVKDARGSMSTLRDDESDVGYSGPLAVLTSRASASASEILAGALQDYGRAVIVGEKSTFGKGTVQSVLELAPYMPSEWRAYKPGALKLTVQKFYRISGGSTQTRGVVPDISLPSLADHMDIAESSLKNFMPYDEVARSAYQPDGVVGRVLPALRNASAERVAASPEFGYVREDIERYKKRQAEKAVSLNEGKRLAEKAADDALVQARKKERAARKLPPQEAVEITLESLENGTPAVAVPPALSTAATTAATGASDDDYEKAPPAPDAVLDETIRIVGDLAAQVRPGSAAAAH